MSISGDFHSNLSRNYGFNLEKEGHTTWNDEDLPTIAYDSLRRYRNWIREEVGSRPIPQEYQITERKILEEVNLAVESDLIEVHSSHSASAEEKSEAAHLLRRWQEGYAAITRLSKDPSLTEEQRALLLNLFNRLKQR